MTSLCSATFPHELGMCLFLSTPMCACVCEGLFVCGVNIGVKRRGHADHQLRGRRGREQLCALRRKHKSTPVGRITSSSYLASLCLPFFLNSTALSDIRCVRFSTVSSLAVTLCTSLSPLISCFFLLASLHA